CTMCGGGTSCVNGTCQCASSSQMVCNNVCTDITTTAHCGSCTNAGSAGENCTNGPGGGGGPAGADGGMGGTTGGPGGDTGGMTGGLGGNGVAGANGGMGSMTGGGGSTRPAGCPANADTISDFEEGTSGITIPQGGRQGWWYTFSDPTAGASQTPAKNASGPV